MDFSKFDEVIDTKKLAADAAEIQKNSGTGEYEETPAGEYRGKIEKLEVGATKDGRPMLKVQFRITDGDQKKRCLFMNRVLYGTKNDANMIASAVGWLLTLEPSEDIKVGFESFSQFSELVLDIAEDVAELEYLVDYNPEEFNNIKILDVFE